MLLLMPRFSYPRAPQDLTALLLRPRIASLRDHLAVRLGLGCRLEPRPFSGPQTSTGKLLRYF